MGAAPSQGKETRPIPSNSVDVEVERNVRKTVDEARENGVEDLKKPIADPPKKTSMLPHNYDTILKEADNLSKDNLQNSIYSGVFLNQKRKMYWVDEESGCNCFTLFARELSITWSEERNHWWWFPWKETSDVDIEVAHLLNVCWLEVHGTFNMKHLTPRTTYEVAFVVMIKDPAYGWEVPVTLRLMGSGINTQEHTECLLDKLRGRWIELIAGDFTTTSEDAGEVQFSLFEYEGGLWKRGLVIKGAIIRPKK